jgi:ribosomal protein L11 methyltransferase
MARDLNAPAGEVDTGAGFSEEALFAAAEHPTTQLCRELISQCASRREVRRMLDVGTGDGVLALHASLLGVPEIVAVDRDGERAAAAHARVRRAALSARIEVRAQAVEAMQGAFDLVSANLWGDDLVAAASHLARLTAPAGDLVVSGLRLWQVQAVRRAFEQAGLILRGLGSRAGWAALHLWRPVGA